MVMMMTMMITVVMYGTWDGKGVLWLKMGAPRLIHQPLVSSGWHAQTRPRNNLNHWISLLVGCLVINNVLKPTRLTTQDFCTSYTFAVQKGACVNNIYKGFSGRQNCTSTAPKLCKKICTRVVMCYPAGKNVVKRKYITCNAQETSQLWWLPNMS